MADITSMKGLMDNIKTFLETAITAGDLSAIKVFKGIDQDIKQIPTRQMPYISLDDGGEETTTDNAGNKGQGRIYRVLVEIGAYSPKNLFKALDNLLDVYNEMKNVFELEANRQGDGMVFGNSVNPFSVTEENFFFRGRQMVIEYTQLEDIIFNY